MVASGKQLARLCHCFPLVLFLLLFSKFLEQPGNFIIVGKLLAQVLEDYFAFLIMLGSAQLSGVRKSLLFALFPLLVARRTKQPTRFFFRGIFLLQGRRKSDAIFQAVSRQQISGFREAMQLALFRFVLLELAD